MEAIQLSSIRNHLLLRKDKLDNAVKTMPDRAHLISLIKQVDSALEKLDHGTYGICEICHGIIDEERIFTDPLVTVCLDCLDDVQQKALESDLEFAAKIQHNLLPKNNLKISGWEFSYFYDPAGAVSGDFVDLIPLKDDSVLFVIGDVSGKGIAASLMMSHLHGLIHSLLSFGLQVNEIVDKANKLFCQSTLFSNYATLVIGKASGDGMVEICVAGHNPPLIFTQGNIGDVNATGVPVGLFCEAEYGVNRVSFSSGDSLFLYTDGLTEAYAYDVEYGEERVKTHLRNSAELNPQNFVNLVVNDHKSWLGNNRSSDDISIMMMKRM